ncbi:MAG: sulfite exporter TauE/SafE family protein [Candidatus Omnitrophica bacterium]|nr:sulfite exporter TauE/SafE family protein [Candidatus Omnitrophota bacterium]
MSQIASYILWGLIAGIASGFLGIGGGIIIIPALVLIFGLTQHQAQGTTLALMIPPIGLLAAMKYYQAGNVNLKIALFVCLGFFFGGYLGASFVHHVPDVILRKVFGVVMLFVSLKLIFLK